MEQSQLKQGNDPNPRGKAIPTQAAEPRNSLAQPVRAGFVQEGKDRPGGAQANSVKESQRGGPSRSLVPQVARVFWALTWATLRSSKGVQHKNAAPSAIKIS